MERVEIKDLSIFKSHSPKCDSFWYNDKYGIAGKIKEIFDNNRIRSMYRDDDPNIFSQFVGEDTIEYTSNDGKISFFARYDNYGKPIISNTVMVNDETGDLLAFNIEKGKDDGTVVTYSKAERHTGKYFTSSRGVEIYTKNEFKSIENSIDMRYGSLLRAESSITYTDDHSIIQQTITGDTRKINIEEESLADINAFRQNLKDNYTSCSYLINGQELPLGPSVQMIMKCNEIASEINQIHEGNSLFSEINFGQE